jgi:hypothetical protein
VVESLTNKHKTVSSNPSREGGGGREREKRKGRKERRGGKERGRKKG